MIAASGPRAGELVGVLDLDSPILERFDDVDRAGLEKLVAAIMAGTLFRG
jgi:putative methionine-R-sulfoxide reductase with GAF domain